MSRYTTEVRFICESLSGRKSSAGYNSIDTIITAAAPLFFPAFPIFDENYRLILEKKILKHFYTREICEETFGLFKLRLDDKLNTIMPYYNKLYETELLEFNPLYTADYTRQHEGSSGSNSTASEHYEAGRESEDEIDGLYNDTSNASDSGTNTHTSTAWDLYSDEPQGQLSNIDNERYLTNARKNTDSSSDSSSSSGQNIIDRTEDRNMSHSELNESTKTNTAAATNTDAYIEHVSGNMGGNFSELLLKFRETIINIDSMILEELEPLFFGLWN